MCKNQGAEGCSGGGVLRRMDMCFLRENNRNRKIVAMKAKSTHGFMSYLLKGKVLFCTIVHLAKKGGA